MEYSFFLVLATLAGMVITAVGYFIIRPLSQLISVKHKSIPGSGALFNGITIGSLLFVFLSGWVYLPLADHIWSVFSDGSQNFLSGVPVLRNSRLIDAYFILQFFRGLYPAFAGLLFFQILWKSLSGHKALFVRLSKSFRHWIAPVMGLFWLGYLGLPVSEFKPALGLVRELLLNGAVFLTMLYAFNGFMLTSYALRRAGLQTWVGMAAVYTALVLSGPVFMFTSILFMGIGISDAWMRYSSAKKRGRVFKQQ